MTSKPYITYGLNELYNGLVIVENIVVKKYATIYQFLTPFISEKCLKLDEKRLCRVSWRGSKDGDGYIHCLPTPLEKRA